MNYFETNYNTVRLPIAINGTPGLRNAQLGAIHNIAGHFTLSSDDALVVMPTGSGKTAVQMLAAYLLRARRVLVITPNRLVRHQITEEYQNLLTLKKAGVLGLEVPTPNVFEVEEKITSTAQWQALSPYDVVVGIPNSLSPAIEGIASPPEDFFDLVLVDEAHHSPAKSWNALLTALPQARIIKFTATPFRRDWREIKGKHVYVYPVSRAYEDNIFGSIEYHAVTPGSDAENDSRIALAAETMFKADRAQNLEHLLMIRTDSKERAKELKKVYQQHTSLRLELVTSDYSYGRIKKTIERLRAFELDGIICVDMLGEGFDLPQLKIAAIHAPHKSLAITLQFIGRFARTNAPNLGTAKFLALPEAVEGELGRLYTEGAIWQKMVIDLSQGRIEEEIEALEVIENCEPPSLAESEAIDLSLHALWPYSHVKIFQVSQDADVDLELELPDSLPVIFRQSNAQVPFTVFIARYQTKPRWTDLEQFTGSDYHLFVVYFDRQTRLLFINSSVRHEQTYEAIAAFLTAGDVPRPLPLNRINKVLIGLENFDFFNIGMRNRMMKSNTESYRTLAGSRAQKAVNPSDGRLYNRGHIFGRAKDGESLVTIGYSSLSKVWSNNSTRIPELIGWCKCLAERLVSEEEVRTHSGLDWLSVGETVTTIPEGVIAAEWDLDAFKNPMIVSYHRADGLEVQRQLLDFDLEVDQQYSNQNSIRVRLVGEDLCWEADFSLTTNSFFSFVTTTASDDVAVLRGTGSMKLLDYLNGRPLSFYFADFSRLQQNNLFKAVTGEQEVFDTASQIIPIDWEHANVDITVEYGQCPNGKVSIQDHLKKELITTEAQIVYYDHGSGEIADFVTFALSDKEILIQLYHCKGAGGQQAGRRAEDLYEVCGQVVKSLIWIHDNESLRQKIEKRVRNHQGSEFLKGDKELLKEFVLRARTLQTRYEIVIVQPGVSQSSLPEKMGHLLAAANDYIIRGQCCPLKVWASA